MSACPVAAADYRRGRPEEPHSANACLHSATGCPHAQDETVCAIVDYPVVSVEQLGADGLGPWAAISIAAWHERLAADQPGFAARRHRHVAPGSARRRSSTRSGDGQKKRRGAAV